MNAVESVSFEPIKILLFHSLNSPLPPFTGAVVPISFPGTVISFAIGSFFNLFFALVFRTEAPYNLLYVFPLCVRNGLSWPHLVSLSRLQFLSVWGPTISLVNSYFTSTNRLDLFSYCFVPLSICSCIPIAIAIALCRLEDLHVSLFHYILFRNSCPTLTPFSCCKVLSPDASFKRRCENRRARRQARGEDATNNPGKRERPSSTRTDFSVWAEEDEIR